MLVVKKIENKIRYFKCKLAMKKVLKIKDPNIKVAICGGEGYGGFGVVEDGLNKSELIVYTFGIGEDLSFSEDVIKKFDCQIFAFDPTPKSITYVNNHWLSKEPRFRFMPVGLADKCCKAEFYLPKNKEFVSGSLVKWDGVDEKDSITVDMKDLNTIMNLLNHEHIDILKMDIEGAEFDVVHNILHDRIDFYELCIEVHNRFFDDGITKLQDMIDKLGEHGYSLVYISKSMEELTFVRNDGLGRLVHQG